jgi:hypothetical protein
VAHTERDLARALQAKAEEAQINLANKNREMRSDQLWLTRVVDALPRCHYCSQIGTVTDRYTYFCDEHNPGQDYLTEVSYAEAVRGRK